MSTRSEDFFLLICLEVVKFVSLSLFTLVETGDSGERGLGGENRELKQRRF